MIEVYRGRMEWGGLVTSNGVIEFTPNHDYQLEGIDCYCLFFKTARSRKLLLAIPSDSKLSIEIGFSIDFKVCHYVCLVVTLHLVVRQGVVFFKFMEAYKVFVEDFEAEFGFKPYSRSLMMNLTSTEVIG